MNKPLSKYLRSTAYAVIALMNTFLAVPTFASDHDDGEISLKGRALNLTDVYAFREDWQNTGASQENLILVMNTNPRSVARQQYYFDSNATYTFHLSQVQDQNKTRRPTGSQDVSMSLRFEPPLGDGRQAIWLTMARRGSLLTPQRGVFAGYTSTLAQMNAGSVTLNPVNVAGRQLTVFAGLREDPFYFDVERYFRIRALLATGANTLGSGPTQGGGNPFRSDATAVDFTAGYNVNSIVLRIPLPLLRQSVGQNVFDVWETISIPTIVSPTQGFEGFVGYILSYLNYYQSQTVQQIERLGRPAINEGLVLSNAKLNAFNSIGPASDLSPAAQPVLAEAGAVLTAAGNYGRSLGLPAPQVGDVVAGFLPDVMRIDTRLKLAPATPAYNSDFVIVQGTTAGAMLTGGRKIEDDVMDVTLSYLIAGDPSGRSIKDGVSYSGGTSCTNAGQGTNVANPGHKCLTGQSSRSGAAYFPFLASPN
jgi:hypothetical protein